MSLPITLFARSLCRYACCRGKRKYGQERGTVGKISGRKVVGYRGPLDLLPNCAMQLMAERGYLYGSTLKDCDWAYVHEDYPLVELPTEPTLDDFSWFYFSYADEATITCSYPVDYVYDIWKDNFDELANEGDKILCSSCIRSLSAAAAACACWNALLPI